MSNHTPHRETTQIINAGRNATQTGRDHTSSLNVNVSFFLIGILALGGIAWGLYVGVIAKPSVNQSQPQPSQSSLAK